MRLDGSICALVTPWDADDQLDVVTLKRLIEWHIEAGTDALVLAGSTGESSALEEAELEHLWHHAQHVAQGRITLIAGTGNPSTARALRYHALAERCGMNAGLVVTPAYVRPTQEGLYQHFARIADSGFPVVLYNVPTRTGCDLLPETVRRLQSGAAIVGLKEAVADEGRWHELAALARSNFTLLSGDDPSCLNALRVGFQGVISVAANVAPARFSSMVHSALSGDWEAAEAKDRELQALYEALSLESNPIPVKFAVAALGFGLNRLRLPLTPLSNRHHDALVAVLGLAQDPALANAA